MKQTYKVALLPEVNDFLDDLAQTLLEKDYVSYLEHGENIVDDIIDFVKTIPYAPHYHLAPYAQTYFNRYGQNLQYTFFKRKSSKHTTWYIFFSRQDGLYNSTLYHQQSQRRKIHTSFHQGGGLTLRFSSLNPIRQYKHFRFSQYSRFNWMSDCVSPALWTSIPDRAKAVTI